MSAQSHKDFMQLDHLQKITKWMGNNVYTFAHTNYQWVFDKIRSNSILSISSFLVISIYENKIWRHAFFNITFPTLYLIAYVKNYQNSFIWIANYKILLDSQWIITNKSQHTKNRCNVLSLEEGCGDAHQQENLLRTLNKNLDMSFIKPETLSLVCKHQ